MRLAWRLILWALWLCLLIAVAVESFGPGFGDPPFYVFMVPGYGCVGVFLAARRPGNSVGWLLAGAATAGALSIVFPSWVNAWQVAFPLMACLFGIFLLVFPDGALPSRRWRPVAVSAALGCLVVAVNSAPPPYATALFVVGLVACALAPLTRYRHSTGLERLQLKWLALAVGIVAGSGVAALLAFQTGARDSVGNILALAALGALVLGIPGAIALAVLRYRLYEINRLLSRTVSYALLVVVLGAVYVGGITWLTSMLPDQSQLVVAATTLAVATLFNPLRKRVQGWVDRRFNRSRYDTQRVMDGFAGALRDQVDAEAVVDGWVGVVSETMQPASVSVWVREG
jgi:hypothetical protein